MNSNKTQDAIEFVLGALMLVLSLASFVGGIDHFLQMLGWLHK